MNYTNNTLIKTSFSLLLLVSLFFFGASAAFAATDNAVSNEGFTQGLQKNGGLVNVLRSNPSAALGATDGSYVSLGYGGELIVGFNQNMSGNLLLTVQEVTGGTYPTESADVYVGENPAGPWTLVGEATNEDGLDDGASDFEVSQCYQYVRVVDTTDGALHTATSDGFDVDSFTANYDESCPVVEPVVQMPSKTTISLHSKAMVMNKIETSANTGNNSADGSYAGSGGNGGDVGNTNGDQDVEGVVTGNGGTGGTAGFGGAVQTGNALAESSITNTVNSNVVQVNGCGCDLAASRVRIRTHDMAFLGNHANTSANTGDNEALGSYAGTGGNGGAVNNEGYDNNEDDDEGEQEVDDTTTGNGGVGGNSSDGGSILTGIATTRMTLSNVVNSNRIRVR